MASGRVVAAAALGGVAAWLAFLLHRRLRERRPRWSSPASRSVVEARLRGCAWALSDLSALELLPHGLLFVYKQHDLQLDRPAEPVTLQTQLCARYPELRDGSTAHGFRLIHQLDCATSGVLAVGLNKKAAARGARLFAERKAVKNYLALVHGHVAWDRMTCSRTIGGDPTDPTGFRMAIDGTPGKHSGPSHTELSVVCRGQMPDGRPVTKLLLRPHTGRRHQLRLHCLCLGHPVVGDLAYTGDARSPRLMLHAWILRMPFEPPVGTITVETSDPFSVEAPGPFSVEASGRGHFPVEEVGGSSASAAGLVGLELAPGDPAPATATAGWDVEGAGMAGARGQGGTEGGGERDEAGGNDAGDGVAAEGRPVFGWPEARPKTGVWISQRDPGNLDELLLYLRGRAGVVAPAAAGVAPEGVSASAADGSRGVARA